MKTKLSIYFAPQDHKSCGGVQTKSRGDACALQRRATAERHSIRIFAAHSAKISYYFLTSIFLGVYLLACIAPDNILLYLFPKFAEQLIKQNLTTNTTLSLFLFLYCIWNIHLGIYELLISLEEITNREIKKKRMKAFVSIAFFVIACFLIKYEAILYFFLFFAMFSLYKQIGNKSLLPPFIASIAWFIASLLIDFLTGLSANNIITGSAFLFLQLSLWIYLCLFCLLFSSKFCKYPDNA